MKTSAELTKLANIAFRRAMVKVVERAEAAGTTIVIWENEKIKHLTPRQARARLNGKKGKRQ